MVAVRYGVVAAGEWIIAGGGVVAARLAGACVGIVAVGDAGPVMGSLSWVVSVRLGGVGLGLLLWRRSRWSMRAAGRGMGDRARIVVGIGVAGRGRGGRGGRRAGDRPRGVVGPARTQGRCGFGSAERIFWRGLGGGLRVFGTECGFVSRQIGGRDLAVGDRIVERIAERQAADRPRWSLARIDPLPAIAALRSYVLDRLSAVRAGLHAADISTAYLRILRV